MDPGRPQRMFFALGSVFVTCLVVSDIIGGAKVADLGTVYGRSVTVSVGMIAFPLTFVLTDVLNEFYGARAVRFMTYVGLAMLLLTYAILWAASSLRAASYTPYPPQWFQGIFGSSLRLILASLTAYLAGQLLDIALFVLFKRWARGRYIWLRATGSTVVSQLLDTIVVQFINFAGVLAVSDIWTLAQNSYVLKLVLAIALTPAIYLGHAVLGRTFHLQAEPES